MTKYMASAALRQAVKENKPEAAKHAKALLRGASIPSDSPEGQLVLSTAYRGLVRLINIQPDPSLRVQMRKLCDKVLAMRVNHGSTLSVLDV